MVNLFPIKLTIVTFNNLLHSIIAAFEYFCDQFWRCLDPCAALSKPLWSKGESLLFLGRNAFLFSCYFIEKLQAVRKGWNVYLLFLSKSQKIISMMQTNLSKCWVQTTTYSIPTADIVEGENLGFSTCSRKRNVEDLRWAKLVFPSLTAPLHPSFSVETLQSRALPTLLTLRNEKYCSNK